MTMLGWFVYEETGSAFQVTLVGFSGMGPLVLLGVFGGMLAERLNKRNLLLATQTANLVAAVAISALIFSDFLLSTDLVRYWHAYIVMLIGGIGWGLDMPSRRSIVLDVLGRARVNNAIALDSVGMHSSRMLGPLLGGFLITVSQLAISDGYGLEAGYAVTLIFHLGSVVLMMRVRTPPSEPSAVIAITASSVFRNLAEGFRYVCSESTLLAVVLITVFMNLLLFPYQQLIPVIAKDVLHVDATLMGLLLALEGLGALTGAILIASASGLTHHGRVYLFGSLAGLVVLLLFSFSQWYGVSLALMMLMGLGTAGFGTMQATIILLVARDDMRGRGLGIITLAIGAGPIGALMIGTIADATSAPIAMTINAVLGIITVGLVGLLMPSLRGRMTSDSEAEEDTEDAVVQPAPVGTQGRT